MTAAKTLLLLLLVVIIIIVYANTHKVATRMKSPWFFKMFQPLSLPEFLARPRQRPGNWRCWYEDFIVFDETYGSSEWSDSRRTTLLMAAVGAKARRFYWAAAPGDKPGDVKTKVSDVSEWGKVGIDFTGHMPGPVSQR